MQVNLDEIRHIRKEKGLSIYEMAKMLELANGSVYWKRENGTYKFKAEEIMMISHIFQIPIDHLFFSLKF